MKIVPNQIRIPYDELGKSYFQQAMMKLAHSPMKTPKAFAVKFITKEIRDGFTKMRDTLLAEIYGKYAEKNDPPAEGTKSFEMKLPFLAKPGLEGDAKGALDAFGKQELIIERGKLDGALLFDLNEWTPRELEAMEYIFTEPKDA